VTLTTAYPLGADSAELKALLKVELYPYQREGALFVARALKRIDSPYAIVLTGTPLENRLEELISIVQFVDQHRLGPTWRLLDAHQQRDERGRVVGYRELHRIGQTLAPIMLRRRKSEVLEQLPERVDNTLFMPMSPLQAESPRGKPPDRRAHRAALAAYRLSLRKGPTPSALLAAEHAHGVQQQLSHRPRNRRRLQGRRAADPARRPLR
jgi:hypothetical protein